MDFLHLVILLVAVALAYAIAVQFIDPRTRSLRSGVVLAVVPLLVGLAIVASIGQIQAGSVGVVTTFGAPTGRVLSPGIYVVTPFVTSVSPMDTQIRAYKVSTAEAASSDLQTVHTDLVINYNLDPDPISIIKVYTTLRDEYTDRLINPIVLESVKAVTAKFTAQDLIDRRTEVTMQLTDLLRQHLRPYGIVVDNVSLTQFSFSDQFNAAIEAKVTQEQQALQARAKLQQVQYEAQQTVTKARAEAQSLMLQRQAVTPELVRLREIEVERALVDKWDGKMPTVLGSGGLLNLPGSILSDQAEPSRTAR